MTDSQIHWISIVNALMIIIFLTGMFGMIMLRNLHRDLVRYSSSDPDDPNQEETGWKLVHGDVFRQPERFSLLATLVGTGVHIFVMAVATIVAALMGFLVPANRGWLLSGVPVLYVLMGSVAGYTSTRLFTMFGAEGWRKNSVQTSLLYPGFNFVIFLILNAAIWSYGSSGAIPFFELFGLLFLWLFVSVPLVYIGSFIAFRKPPLSAPIKINRISRQIPTQPWYLSSPFSILVGGVLPFGAVFIEAVYIMSSIWLHRFYFVFGFLFIVFAILIVTCVEISIVMCYFQLCSEDYKWWWRSFFTSGASALYLFLYSILYFFTKLDITKFVSGLLFFGYMFLICIFFFVLTGSIGFIASLLFVRKIYSSVKLD